MLVKHRHEGHRARLRARFEKDPNGLEDHELLELLLFYAIPQKDTNALAHDLLYRFDSIANVLNAKPAQLREISGIGEVSSQMFSVVLEVLRRYFREKATRKPPSRYDPEYIGSLYLSSFFGKTEEQVLAIALNMDLSVQEDLVIGQGDFVSSTVNTTMLSEFINHMKPCHIVIAHNHPSGVALPSETDFKTTDYLREFIFRSGSNMLDHLIFDGRGDFVSLGVSGQLTDTNRHYYKVTQTSGDAPGEIQFGFEKMPLVAEIMTKNQTKGDKP